MTDRIPGAPGQYKAVVTDSDLQKMQAGEQFTITLVRDDQPITEGTPYSKAAVLPDELAAVICPGVTDPSPADALASIWAGKAPAGYVDHYFEYGIDSALDNWLTRIVSEMSTTTTVRAIIAAQSLDLSLPSDCWHVEITKLANSARARFYVHAHSCYRNFDGTSWSAYTWDNPPMLPGVEYCTTERLNGNVVFKKNINGVYYYRLDGESDWKPYYGAAGAAPAKKETRKIIEAKGWYRIGIIGKYACYRIALSSIYSTTGDFAAIIDVGASYSNPVLKKTVIATTTGVDGTGTRIVDAIRLVNTPDFNQYYVDFYYNYTAPNPVITQIDGPNGKFEQYSTFETITDANINGTVSATLAL